MESGWPEDEEEDEDTPQVGYRPTGIDDTLKCFFHGLVAGPVRSIPRSEATSRGSRPSWLNLYVTDAIPSHPLAPATTLLAPDRLVRDRKRGLWAWTNTVRRSPRAVFNHVA